MRKSLIRILVLAAVSLVLLVIVLNCSCAKTRDKWAAQGSMFTSTKADYIVISQSGGLIMDVWKLRGVIVQSEDTSDGWLFLDTAGHPIFIGGDVKTIRLLKDKTIWEKYHEYHMEFEAVTYREKFNSSIDLQKP